MLGNLNTTGSLQVSSTGGDLTQAAGTAVVAGGVATLVASLGGTPAGIVLDQSGNDFQSAVNASGAQVRLSDTNALTPGTVTATGDLTATSSGPLTLGTSTVGGNLSANSGNGNITQTGALTVTGTSNLNAGTGDITLANAANNFVGAVSA